MEESLWRGEGGKGGTFGDGSGGSLEGGGDWRWFLIRGFGGDYCGVHGLMVSVEVFVFVFSFFFSPCEADN